MQTSKLAKSIFKYLLLFDVIAVAVIVMFMAKNLYQTSLDSQITTTTQSSGGQNNPQSLIIPGDSHADTPESQCISSVFYTSLPAKWLNSNGKLIQLNGESLNMIVVPEGK